MEFQFAHSIYFLLLFVVLLIVVLYMFVQKQKAEYLALLTKEYKLLLSNRHTKRIFYFFASALVLLTIAAANPQWGMMKTKVQKQSTDVLVALDISKSMYAEDQSPNRLERAKRFAKDLLKNLRSERVGTILFAGDAFLQMPLSHDHKAAQLFLSVADADMISAQGTALSQVMVLADSTFGQENTSQKVLIIITDGEDHEEGAVEQAQSLADNNVVIFTIGVGSPEGAFVMDHSQAGRIYLKDSNGDVVRSALNDQLLKQIAKSTGGGYFHIDNAERIFKMIKSHLNNLIKKTETEVEFESKHSFYQYFLLAGIMLLFFESRLRKLIE